MTLRKDSSDRLEIRPEGFRRNIIDLLERVHVDEYTMTSFIQNPVDLVTNRVMARELPPQQVSEANRLLFALIANDEMRDWLDTYEANNQGKRLNKEEFAVAFAKKINELDDENILIALVSNAAVGNGIPGFTDVMYQCVVRETPNKDSVACTPVAKDTTSFLGTMLNPDILRSITEALIVRAKELSASGQLANLSNQIL